MPISSDLDTLRSLLNKLARLTVLNTVKRASSFIRDLRVALSKSCTFKKWDWLKCSVHLFWDPRLGFTTVLSSMTNEPWKSKRGFCFLSESNAVVRQNQETISGIVTLPISFCKFQKNEFKNLSDIPNENGVVESSHRLAFIHFFGLLYL